MKRYLDLVPITARVHRGRNRMSLFCIALAAFLVTAIFGMADMFVRSQILRAQSEYGSWHIALKDISFEDAALVEKRPDIAVCIPYGTLNYGANRGYLIGGKETVLFGTEESCLTELMPDMITEGRYPEQPGGAIITENARIQMGLSVGDSVQLQMPDGNPRTCRLTGFAADSAGLTKHDAYGLFLCLEDFYGFFPENGNGEPADFGISYYLKFRRTWDIRQKITSLRAAFGLSEGQVAENTMLLGLLGQSGNSFMLRIYASAGILFVFVLCAGVMMIAGSLNSSVAQRTEFFGLLRCLGATPRQVMRLVRREALYWCRIAIPAGLLTGTALIWVLCAILRWLSPVYFAEMPVLSVSLPGLVSGGIVGLLTVLLAARTPAKRAACVSPLEAVSGGAGGFQPARHAANTRRLRVETALGIHHACASRKNLLLMAGSFALSVVLFLSFSVTVDFMRHALTTLRPWTADLSIISPENACAIDSALVPRLEAMPAVKAAFGRSFAYDLPAEAHGEAFTADLISYEERQFGWAEKYLLEGSVDAARTGTDCALSVYRSDSPLRTGDSVTVTVNGERRTVGIAGMLSAAPFDGTLLICSEETFRSLTGAKDYTILDIQLSREADDTAVEEIRSIAGSGNTFSDSRMDNRSTRGAYYSFGLFIYGFLVLIAMITLFHIINSIAMSVSARMRQYGAFRAVGLSMRQLERMVIAEACTYTLFGSAAGTGIGLVCSRLLFRLLITPRWGDPWGVPWASLGVILAVVLLAVVLAVKNPIRTLRRMSIVDTIGAQ